MPLQHVSPLMQHVLPHFFELFGHGTHFPGFPGLQRVRGGQHFPVQQNSVGLQQSTVLPPLHASLPRLAAVTEVRIGALLAALAARVSAPRLARLHLAAAAVGSDGPRTALAAAETPRPLRVARVAAEHLAAAVASRSLPCNTPTPEGSTSGSRPRSPACRTSSLPSTTRVSHVVPGAPGAARAAGVEPPTQVPPTAPTSTRRRAAPRHWSRHRARELVEELRHRSPGGDGGTARILANGCRNASPACLSASRRCR